MKKVFLIMCMLTSMIANAQTIYIMGGKDHSVFLGLFNASPYDSRSIWNAYGSYGSKYNSDCIWNEYGTYGSKYNSYCPWNKYSSEAPILVDKEGNNYVYFNESNKNEVVRRVFKAAESIMDGDLSLSEWYDLLFK